MPDSFTNLRHLIEHKRNSPYLHWRILVYLKDLMWRIRRNDSVLCYPIRLYYYLVLLVGYGRSARQGSKTAAIVLSWKRTQNLPQIIVGLKRQSFIGDIYILHNHPSNLWIPGCKNIFFKENKGCIVRHQFAADLEGYDFFAFSDDDLMLKDDLAEDVLSAIEQHGKESVLGLFGIELGQDKPEKPYTSGIYRTAEQSPEPVDIILGRFHIISSSGIRVMAESGLDTEALRSEDDIRANLALQREFKKPSYLIPMRNRIVELQDNHALKNRNYHFKYRDRAIQDGISLGWKQAK